MGLFVIEFINRKFGTEKCKTKQKILWTVAGSLLCNNLPVSKSVVRFCGNEIRAQFLNLYRV